MQLLKRLFGICQTPLPADQTAWQHSPGAVAIDLARMPELVRPGQGVRLEGRGLPCRLLVFHGDDGRYHAVVNRCTHAGRRIDVVAGSQTIQCCSVSRSTFAYDGRPVGGAAKSALTPLAVRQTGDTLTIQLP